MRSDLFFKVEVEHESGAELEALITLISRQLQKLYSVRSAEVSSVSTSDE